MYLMRRIELFLKRAEMAPTRFGRETVGDPRLVGDMKNGRELRGTTAARIVAWLEARENQA
jgi:hypothetical protein